LYELIYYWCPLVVCYNNKFIGDLSHVSWEGKLTAAAFVSTVE